MTEEKKKETIGLKRMTKANSKQVRLSTSGKYVPDTDKPNRKYKVKGE
jgi:hypothetical protein